MDASPFISSGDAVHRSRRGGAREAIAGILERIDVRLDGDRPWDVQVRDDRFYRRLLTAGSLGAGESYVEGWWDCEALDELFYRVLRGGLDQSFRFSWRHVWNAARSRFLNLQSPVRASRSGRHHYDRGNDLFERMLDRRMVYSSGYWREAQTLDEAQEAKLDLICRKLRLEPGMRVLDIGCGWGGFALFAAERYDVEVVGVTVAREQAALARQRCEGWPIEIRLQDYREVDERFDAVVSIGMFEHVGPKNHGTYMEVVGRCLEPDGLSLLHTIGRHGDTSITDPWTERYIFPNGCIPSARQVVSAVGDRMVIEDWENFGADYDRTLMAWHQNFEATWPEIAERYGERFHRMWRYFLLTSAGSFRARRNQVWHIVMSPRGVEGGWGRESGGWMVESGKSEIACP